MLSRSKSALTAMFLVLLLAALLAAPPALDAQRNVRVRRFNLTELTIAAHTIVVGKIATVQVEPHPHLSNVKTLVVTVEIGEVWKGQTGAPFSFRQYVSDLEDIRTKLDYRVGQEVLLFMTRPSKYGLSSPVGLEQGRFRIHHDGQGNRSVLNGANNVAIFNQMDPNSDAKLQTLNSQARRAVSQHRGGPIEYDQFKAVVSAVLGGTSN